jgi:hypothetical protein
MDGAGRLLTISGSTAKVEASTVTLSITSIIAGEVVAK